MVTVRHAGPADLPEVAAFYHAAGYGGVVSPSDDLLLAEVDQSLTAVVRLAHEHGVTVLRGMRVAPALQRQGIGQRLLQAVDATLGLTPCYCVPYAHLVQFYGQIGFQEIAPAAAPPFLAERLATYRRERPEAFTLMCRYGQPAGRVAA